MTSEAETAFPERPADADPNPNQAGQTSTQHQGAQSHGCADEDQREIRLENNGVQHRQQLEFQDSTLSPGLPLLPTNHEGEPQLTEYSLFQQSGNEFAPLRPDLGMSAVSEEDFAPQDCTTQASEQELLSEYPLMETTLLSEADRKDSPPTENTEPVSGPQDHPEVEDEAFFLKKEITAQHLLELLQKDIGMLTDSSSTVSSECVVSGNINPPVPAEPSSSQTCEQAAAPAEAPQEALCKVSLSQKRGTLVSEDPSVTTGPRSSRPDRGSQVLLRQLLKETEQPNRRPGEASGTDRVLAKGSGTGPFSAGVERSQNEQHLCSPGNQTDIDGSYLGFLPQSQSTPGIFNAPAKSSIQAKAEQLSAIQSRTENSSGSDAGLPSQERAASADVPSLPSVSYAQKVDAWRANQTGRTSLLDSLALQGSSGLSSTKTAHGAASDTQGHLPSGNVSRPQQVPLGSASAREEVASSVPGGNDDTSCSKGPSALLSTASQSSLSTVTSGRKLQRTRSSEENLRTDKVQQEPGAQPSAPLGLARFRDASADPDLTPSTSQDSNGSGTKFAKSIGTSSVVSLEVDNYAPYWTPRASTPPPQQQPRELNIEERIPVYLQNLGIDQSPSTILTPFLPRGPIREPEFSPTDLCTIKGSTGTPTKSTQTSEGDSPNKAEFSGGSVMSVDSSISIAFSLDSLGPGASIPEQLVQPSTLDPQEQNQAPSSPQPDEDSYPSTLQTTLHQQRGSSLTSSQNTIQVGDRFDSDGSLSTDERESSESSFRSSRREFPDTSVVGSKPTSEMRYLPTQAENVLSAGSRVASSPASHILSEENTLVALQEASFSSSAAPEVRENTGAGLSLVPSQSARRTEPEGCSAAPAQAAAAAPPQAAAAAPALQQPPPPADAADEQQAAAGRPEQDVPSPPPKEDKDQGAASDGSSRSSLAVKVTQLLQSESLGSVVSSTSSMTEQEQEEEEEEEGKAREWMKLKVWGLCEPLELHEEDRRRIEEIKRELLRNYTSCSSSVKSQESTDAESATSSSSFPLRREPHPAWEAGTFPPGRDAVRLSASPLQDLSRPDLEAQIREIAAREGVALGRTNLRAFTSITVALHRRSASPAPEPLHLSELSAASLGGHLGKAVLGPGDSGPRRDALTPSGGREGLPGCGSEAAAPEPAARPGHVSHVHLTPMASPATDPGSAPTPKALPPVRRRSSMSSLDEGVGLASPPEWYRNTEPVTPERDHPRALSRTRDGPGSRALAAHRRAVESAGPPTAQDGAPPVLWPYKPKGSEELFYIPQRGAELTSSDTTMESSHPGSDDAVPPRFSSDVLGHGDPEISRGVTIRHTEGIYSRRLETSSYQMQRESTTQTNGSRAPLPSSPAPVTGATAWGAWGPSPAPFPGSTQSESQDGSQPVCEEVDRENSSHPVFSRAGPPPGGPERPLPPSSTLDQLWGSFCASWRPEVSQPTSEASLLERLERLSRLIQNARGDEAPGGSEEEAQRRTGGRTSEVGATGGRLREGGRTAAESCPSRQAWRAEEPPGPTSDSLPHGGPHRQHLCPADRDETDAGSTPGSGSASTVDTARLVRAFGAHRVQLLRSSSGLRRLYSTIDEQRAREEQRGAGTEEALSSTAASQAGQDSAVTAESSSSTSTYTLPPRHAPSRTLQAVRVANKGVQAGHLELVCNGTRRHTRDVGTTFPSPAESRRISSSSSSLEGGGGGWSYPSKTRGRRRSRRSWKVSRGVSWFIPAEELRAEGRKENVHQEEDRWRPSTAWFEAYGRIQPWREPLRQRQAPEDANTPSAARRHEADLGTKAASSAPAGVSLQEALARRRPEFLSQSRQRLRRLALQVEARKLQEVLSRRREERYGRPGGAARQLQPAGNTRRAVPRKEMIQRSKQIYDNLPEVRKRREEERRRAQYDSYRLKAQLYNKRITSHVLGRRTAWQ